MSAITLSTLAQEAHDALERARAGGEPLRLFAPAPAPFPGSVPLEGFYRCGECGGIHDTGARCPNPRGVRYE